MKKRKIKLSSLISEKKVRLIREQFDEYNIVDLANETNELALVDILFLFKVLPKDISGELFTYLDPDVQESLIKAFSGPEINQMLENIYSDDIVDFMEDMPANLTKKILKSATKETRDEINMLLSFKENSAGSIMSTDFVELKENDTVAQAINKIKKQGKIAETINVCYVIDSFRNLVGTILLKEFLFESSNIIIKDIMDSDVISVTTNEDQEEVAKLISKYDITVVPVVNDENRLIGIVTVDDIIDVLEEEVTEDIHKMHAVAPMEDSYIDASVLDIVKSRLPWLLILMISGTFTGSILATFENQLMVVPALSGFIPMIMGTAGNAGSQASTMVIRGIAVSGLKTKDLGKVILKEFSIALICGVVLFIVNFTRISLFPSELITASQALPVAFTVSLTAVVALTFGKIIGGMLPLIVYALHLDPAAVAAPVITTIVDASSLIIYFMLAKLFLRI